MHIEDVMNTDMLTIDSEATVREAAQRMSERNAGAALVVGPNTGVRPGIITERDVLNSVAAGQDPDGQRVADNSTADVVTVTIDSSLEQAVEKMTKGDFRHLLVIHGDEAVGIVSMRDIVRGLTSQ
jgi:CBS domain-containing protein